MARHTPTKQPQSLKEYGQASISPIPRLYWPYCHAENYDRLNISISRSEKFPFQFLHDIKSSIEMYPDSEDQLLVDNFFLKQLCNSKRVLIIQKSFSKHQYKTLISAMKKYADAGTLKTEYLYIISRDKFRSEYVDAKCRFYVKFNANLFKNKCDFHDRIVILDGNIWHFGATVCGMHKTPHAYSGPWEDKDSSLVNFINKIMDHNKL